MDGATGNEEETQEKSKRRESVPVLAEPVIRVPFWKKLLFGFGNFSRYTVLGIQAYFLNAFLIQVAVMDPVWVGNIQLIKQVYDAITDPIIGRISDRTRTRFGRRRIYVLLFSIPCGFLWLMQWYTPNFVSDAAETEGDPDSDWWYPVLYYGSVLLVFSTFNTLVSVPYNALVPDIAKDYHDRTTVVLLQEVFGLSSVIIFSFVQASLTEAFTYEGTDEVDYSKGYGVSALVTLPAVVLPMILAVIFIKEPMVDLDDDENTKDKSWYIAICYQTYYFLASLLKALLFKEFFFVVVLFVSCMLAVYAFVSNFVLYIKFVLLAEQQTEWLLLATQAFATVSFFFWAFLSRRVGKKVSFLTGGIIWIGTSVIMAFLGPDDMAIFYPVSIIRAFGSGVGYLIPLAMLPDIIEIDRIKNNQQREGILYALMVLIQKTGVGLGLSFSNYILQGAGLKDCEDGSQPCAQSVISAFRLLMYLFPIVCVFIGILSLFFIPSGVKHQEVKEVEPKKSLSQRLLSSSSSDEEHGLDEENADLSSAHAFQKEDKYSVFDE